MSFMKQNSARHRAETQSHFVRNTTIGTVVAGAAECEVADPELLDAPSCPGLGGLEQLVAGAGLRHARVPARSVRRPRWPADVR